MFQNNCSGSAEKVIGSFIIVRILCVVFFSVSSIFLTPSYAAEAQQTMCFDLDYMGGSKIKVNLNPHPYIPELCGSNSSANSSFNDNYNFYKEKTLIPMSRTCVHGVPQNLAVMATITIPGRVSKESVAAVQFIICPMQGEKKYKAIRRSENWSVSPYQDGGAVSWQIKTPECLNCAGSSK